MYRKYDEIIVGNPTNGFRRMVLWVDGDTVWFSVGNFADKATLTNTFPIPPTGRKVEAEWRVPVKGDTAYDRANGWITAEDWGCDVPDQLPDPLNVGWRRPVLVPLPAPPSTPLPPVQVTHRHTTPPTYRPPRKGEWYLGNNTTGAVFLATEDWKSTPTWIVQPVGAPAPITAEVVPPKLPELWLAVWPTPENNRHETSHAYHTRDEAEMRSANGCIIVRIPPTAGAT